MFENITVWVTYAQCEPRRSMETSPTTALDRACFSARRLMRTLMWAHDCLSSDSEKAMVSSCADLIWTHPGDRQCETLGQWHHQERSLPLRIQCRVSAFYKQSQSKETEEITERLRCGLIGCDLEHAKVHYIVLSKKKIVPSFLISISLLSF